MNFTKGILKLLGRTVFLLALALVLGRCGSDDGGTTTKISATFRDSGSTTLDAKGYANDPRIVLTGPVGAAYTITVTEGGQWCWTSRRTKATTKSAHLVAANEVVYLYLDNNESGASRRATVDVAFDGGDVSTLTIDQVNYSIPASMDHAWAELPAYVEDPDYLYVTNYAPLSSTVTARNYTICYDKKKRIANWVAYPIHDCYMQGQYVRPDNVAPDNEVWLYNPLVPSEYQVNLSKGSYRSGGIRGHQCMSNHRYVNYKTDASLPSSDLNMQTFYSTNIMPQDYKFNGGSWLKMETVASAKRCADTLYIVTGTWGVRSYGLDKVGTSVAVPEYCWKVLLRTKSGRTGKRIDQVTDASQLMAIGFWAANATSSESGLKEYITSVADIEEKTGYKFFTMLDETIAADVKAQNKPSEWGIN